MKRLVLVGMMACAGMIVTGCRAMQSGGNGGAGGTGGGGGTGGTGGGTGGNGGMDGGTVMKSYTPTTIASMRGVTSGQKDVELDNVISLGVTPSTKSPKLFVQDAAGGDFSAIMVRCETSSTSHPCTTAVAGTVAGIQNGRKVTIKGTYQKSKSGFEALYLDEITDNGAGTAPAAAMLQYADATRSADSAKYWFQRVVVDLGSVQPLKVFDFSPAEFKYSGSASCPAMFGWGMVPSASSDTVGAACAGTTQPASAIAAMATPPTDEIMIGTDFYKGFTFSSDCACASKYKDTLVSAGNTMNGTVSGILVGDVPYMMTTPYQYVAPQANADITMH